MRHPIWIPSLLLVLASCAATIPARHEDGEHTVYVFNGAQNASVHVARRKLDDPFWRDQGLGELAVVGVEYGQVDKDSGWGFEAAAFVGGTDQDVDALGDGPLGGPGSDLELAMGEVSVGARWIGGKPLEPGIHPFLGAGLSLVTLSVDDVNRRGDQEIADGDGAGFYFQGGLRYDVNPFVNFGVLYRTLTSSDLDGFDGDYEQFGLFVGASF